MDKLTRTVYIASDHAGFVIKEGLIKHFKTKSVSFVDLGPETADRVDYPDFGSKLAKKVQFTNDIGILVCGTGTGICISANKHKGIRCSICNNIFIAKRAIDNDYPNVIALGERLVGQTQANEIVEYFLEHLPVLDEKFLKEQEELKEIEEQNLMS